MRFEQEFRQFVIDLWLYIEAQPQEMQGILRCAVKRMVHAMKRR